MVVICSQGAAGLALLRAKKLFLVRMLTLGETTLLPMSVSGVQQPELDLMEMVMSAGMNLTPQDCAEPQKSLQGHLDFLQVLKQDPSHLFGLEIKG